VDAEQTRRLEDVLRACTAIAGHLHRAPGGDPSADELVADALRLRLIEIGEAVHHLDSALLDREPDIPWSQVARMRELLATRDYDSASRIVADCVQHDVPELRAAVLRLLGRDAR
jgi:uncharacterized protein with HEPN domain